MWALAVSHCLEVRGSAWATTRASTGTLGLFVPTAGSANPMAATDSNSDFCSRPLRP